MTQKIPFQQKYPDSSLHCSSVSDQNTDSVSASGSYRLDRSWPPCGQKQVKIEMLSTQYSLSGTVVIHGRKDIIYQVHVHTNVDRSTCGK